MAGPAFEGADENVELEALRDLVDAILLVDYRDKDGVGLRGSVAFLNARAIVDLNDAIGTPRARRE